jgi:hypothetical protein
VGFGIQEKGKPMSTSIEIAVACTYFQKRLCWMASSLLQQVGDVPKLTFSVAYPKNNGNPTTEDVCKYFREKGLNVKEFPYQDEKEIQFRGLVRNAQLAASEAKFILFSDSDMVYDPHFFEDLGKKLEGDLKDETRCISASRVSLDKDYSKNYFNSVDKTVYPAEIPNVASVTEKWPVFQISRNCGAGYFQLANVASLRKLHNGIYVDPNNCNDVPEFEEIHKTKSDRQFRHMVGGIKRIHTLPQYHLNHSRDNEVGYHLTEQR